MYTVIQSFITKLEEKGFVVHEELGANGEIRLVWIHKTMRSAGSVPVSHFYKHLDFDDLDYKISEATIQHIVETFTNEYA